MNLEIEQLIKELKLKELKEKEIAEKLLLSNKQLTTLNEQKQKCIEEMDAIAKSIDDKEELVQKVRENKDKYDNMTEEQMNILMDCKKKEDFHKNIVKTLK